MEVYVFSIQFINENGTNGKGFCNVILDKLDGTKKRYRLETKELQ